jgi:AraC family transcriptional regulator
MLTITQAGGAWIDFPDRPQQQEVSYGMQGLHRERRWRQIEHGVGAAVEDIAISRWSDLQNTFRHEDATTPADRYFIGIALKITRLKLTRGGQAIFDGIMPAGTLYVSAPSKQLSAQFHAPYDFLHFHVSANYFPSQRSMTQPAAVEDLNDLVLLRDPFAEQLAKALTEHGNTPDEKFARCIGQTLAMHLARLEFPRTRVNVLPKWRLRRVEEYVKARFDRGITLSELAEVAGLSRMHFAAQFRAATGYRPREYLLHQRIEHAKSLLSDTKTALAEVALTVGFCNQAHFSTVFKRITGETPARWRCASKNELPSVQSLPRGSTIGRRGLDSCRHTDATSIARNENGNGLGIRRLPNLRP